MTTTPRSPTDTPASERVEAMVDRPAVTPPDPAGGRTLLGHPPGLFLLFCVEMWERFSYYGMRGLLVLYLIAVFAASQLAPGVYTNTLEISQTPAGAAAPASTLTRDFTIAVAQPGYQPPAGGATAPGPAPLLIQKLHKAPDPADPNKSVWVPDAEQAAGPVVIRGPQGGPFDTDEVRYRISNPTSQVVKLNAEIKREGAGARTYFTVNDSSSAVSIDVKPDSQRKPDEPLSELSVKINKHDSGRNWLKPAATNCQGWYAGLCYLVPLIGGLIADKLIGTHRSMLVGGLLIAMGHIALAISGLGDMGRNQLGMDIFVGGLALIVIGTGHFKPSVSVMVGQLYAPGDPRRDGAFSIFYMGINLGAFLCNYVCGTLGQTVGWHWGFGAAAVGMLAGLGMYIVLRDKYLRGIGLPPGNKGNMAAIFIPIGLVLAAVVAVAFHAGVLSKFDRFISNQYVYGTLAVAAVAWAVYFTATQKKEDRGPVSTIFIFTLFNAFFWLAFEQASTSINVFTDERTNRWFMGFELPATWFQSINPFLIFIGAPIFGAVWTYLARRHKNPSQPVKIALGLLFLGFGYVFMTWAGMQAAGSAGKAAWILIAATYFWHTVGELCLSPTGLSYVTKAAPKSSVSLLMGVYLMASFIANLGGGKIAGLVEGIEKNEIKLPWHFGGQADYFFLFVISSGVAGVVILVLTPLLKILMRGRDA